MLLRTNDGDLNGSQGEGTIQFIIEELENIVLTVIEELRQRPTVAMALAAAVCGAVVGAMLAGRSGRAKPVKSAAGLVDALGPLAAALTRSQVKDVASSFSERAAKGAERASKGVRRTGGGPKVRLPGLGSTADLVNLGVRLLQNPIVRGYLVSMIGSRLRRARG